MPNDIDDPAGLRDRLDRQFDILEDADIDDRDRQEMQSWATTMLGNDKALNTVTNRLNPARKTAERAPTPLVDMELDDVMGVIVEFDSGEHDDVPDDGLADGTMRQYRQALRLFFRDQLGHDWGEQIEIGGADRDPVDNEKVLTTDDVDALLEATNRARDAALLAFLIVTGQRITAALSIRAGDANLSDQVGTVTLNDDAVGLKGASGPRPLLWARPYLSSWWSVHPDPSDGAPLFCCVQGGRRPRQDGGWTAWDAGDPMSRTQVKNRFKDIAEAADVDVKKLKPHNLRHTAITRMRDQGVPDDRIKFMVGVDEKSTILERYDEADDERMLDRLRTDHGFETESDTEVPQVGAPSMDDCNQCGAPLRGSARFCSGCGQPLDTTAAMERQRSEAGVADDMVDLEDRDAREVARKALELVRDDPEFAEQVVDDAG